MADTKTNQRIIARFPMFWVDTKGDAVGGDQHLDITNEILKTRFANSEMGKAYGLLFEKGWIRVLKTGVWVEHMTPLSPGQRRWVKDLEAFKNQDAEYDRHRGKLYREAVNRDMDLDEFDELWVALIGEQSLAPAVQAVPSTNTPPAQTNKRPAQGGHALDDAIRKASEMEGDSPDEEEAMNAYLEQMGIAKNSPQARNLSKSLGNLSVRLGGGR